MSGISQNNRKHILEALRNEKNDILKLLKKQSSGSFKSKPSAEEIKPPHKSSFAAKDDIEEKSDLFQQQNLYNQIRSNSNSKRNSISGDVDSINSSPVKQPPQDLEPSNYNYTFNKYNNKILEEQMKLTKEQVEENERYLNRDMQEKEEEQQDEDEELDEVNGYSSQKKQNMETNSHQSNSDHKQNGVYIDQNEFKQKQKKYHDYQTGTKQLKEQQRKHKNQEQHNEQNEYNQSKNNQGRNKSNEQNKRGQYFISDKPANNQKSIQSHKSHQELSQHSKQHSDQGDKASKNTVRDIKQKLINLKQEKEQREKDKIRMRIEEIDKKKAEHVFHPQCKVDEELKRQTVHKDPLTEEERYQVWLRLYDDRAEVYQERNDLKKRNELNRIEANCYHIPEININSKLIAEEKNKENNNMNVEDRLNKEAAKYKQKIKQMKEEKEFNEVKDLSFHPQIYSTPLQSQPPIYERFTEIAKKKQDILHQLKLEQQSTFQPEINPKSAIIAENKINIKDVSERLNQDFNEKQKRQVFFTQLEISEKLQTQILEEKNKECKFQPKTNPISSEIAKNMPLYSGKADVVQRQQVLEKQSRDKKLRVAQEYESNQCSFKPQINQISEILVIENQGRLMETQQQKIERLYKKDLEMKKMKTDLLRQEMESENTFYPSINEVSRYLINDKPRDLDELAYNYAGKMHIKMLQDEKEDEEMRHCSFYPSTTQSVKYMHVPANYNQEKCYKSVKMETQMKEKIVREQRKQYANDEMKECTFTPSINKSKKIDKKKNIDKVKGLEGFLQNKDKAEKIKCDRLQKEDEVFNIHKRYDAETRQKTTTPQPFKLSHYHREIVIETNCHNQNQKR